VLAETSVNRLVSCWEEHAPNTANTAIAEASCLTVRRVSETFLDFMVIHPKGSAGTKLLRPLREISS